MLNIIDSIHINGLEIYIKDILVFSYYDEQSGYKRINDLIKMNILIIIYKNSMM